MLVNNASAISLTGTLATPMKKYDLMNQVNARGTYLWWIYQQIFINLILINYFFTSSRACLPHLIESKKCGKQPHILNISPPLSMKPIWFKNHTAYTIAKYGMSMCVLGMAAELEKNWNSSKCFVAKNWLVSFISFWSLITNFVNRKVDKS